METARRLAGGFLGRSLLSGLQRSKSRGLESTIRRRKGIRARERGLGWNVPSAWSATKLRMDVARTLSWKKMQTTRLYSRYSSTHSVQGKNHRSRSSLQSGFLLHSTYKDFRSHHIWEDSQKQLFPDRCP